MRLRFYITIEILLEHRVDHGCEGVIFDSHGEGDLTVLENIEGYNIWKVAKKVFCFL